MTEAILKAVISVLVTALWGVFIALVRKVAKKQKATDEGLRSLLRAEIIRTYEKTMDRGYCPIYSKEALTHCFDAYTDLDGNGVMPGLYEAVMNAPTDPPTERK